MNTDRIDRLRIASPCPTNWEGMSGDDRVRFCDLCGLNVYNIAEMSRADVEALIAKSEGRICGRLYRRSDGTVITKDCPVGLRAIRRRVAKTAGAVFATVMSLASVVMGQKQPSKDESCQRQVTISRKLAKSATEANVISGTVLDPSGAVASNAKVSLFEVGTQRQRSIESDSNGRFVFFEATDGAYELTIELPGFQKFLCKDLKVAAKESVSLEVILLPAQPTVTVTVGVLVEYPLLIDISSPRTTIISGDILRNLPIP